VHDQCTADRARMLATSTRADIAEEARRKLAAARPERRRPGRATLPLWTMRSVVRPALVLGGGGVAGIAWEIGLLARLPSATSTLPPEPTSSLAPRGGDRRSPRHRPGYLRDHGELPASPSHRNKRAGPALDTDEMAEIFGLMVSEDADRQAVRRRIGSLAKSAANVPEAERAGSSPRGCRSTPGPTGLWW